MKKKSRNNIGKLILVVQSVIYKKKIVEPQTEAHNATTNMTGKSMTKLISYFTQAGNIISTVISNFLQAFCFVLPFVSLLVSNPKLLTQLFSFF